MSHTRRTLFLGTAAAALTQLAPPRRTEAAAPPPVLLGRRNTARTTTFLENSGTGPALAIRGSGTVALSVVGNAHIAGRLSAPGLNADKLDGLDSTAFARALHEHPYAPYEHAHPETAPDYDGFVRVLASADLMAVPDDSPDGWAYFDTLTLPHGLPRVLEAHVELNWWEAVFDSDGKGSWARRSEMAGLARGVTYSSDVPLFDVPRVYWTALSTGGITIRARHSSGWAQYLVRVRIWVEHASSGKGMPSPLAAKAPSA